LEATKDVGRAATEAADVQLGRVGKALLVGDLGAEHLEVALDVAGRLGRVPVWVEAEALGQPGAVGALNRIAQALDRRQDLRREVMLVVCRPKGAVSDSSASDRGETDVPILSSGSFLISSTVYALSAAAERDVLPSGPRQKTYCMTSPTRALPPRALMRSATWTCGWFLASG
jgi:hypothetical protein